MAVVSITLVVGDIQSASLVFTPVGTSFHAPVKANTKIGTLSVSPPDWKGAITIGEPFVLLGMDVLTAVDIPQPGTYTAQAVANP